MNAVFELEVKSSQKLVKDEFCLSYIRGHIVPQKSPAVAADAISIFSPIKVSLYTG